MLPKYKNPAIKIFLSFIDICFGVFVLILFCYANYIYFNKNFQQCEAKQAPILVFFIEIFLLVNYLVIGVLILSVFTIFLRKFSKAEIVDE